MHAIPKSLSRKDCIHVSDFKYELDGSFWLAFVARRQMGPIFSTQKTTITSLFIENTQWRLGCLGRIKLSCSSVGSVQHGLCFCFKFRKRSIASGSCRVKLHIPHVRILTSHGQQFFVCTLLIDDTIAKHNDIIRILNSTQTVGNDEHCAVFSKSIQSFLYRLFGDCIC